jgi:hypothetical protein
MELYCLIFYDDENYREAVGLVQTLMGRGS